MAIIRRATLADAHRLAALLRVEDIAEIKACSGQDPLTALVEAVTSHPNTLVAIHDGEPCAMFGVVAAPHPQVGIVWLLGADALATIPVVFTRHSKRQIEVWHQTYPVLMNVVDARNEVHLKWLRWCGFTFINRHEEFGPEGRPFLEFVRLRPCA